MRVAVVGVGLIGGSVGLAARRRAGATVSGYDSSSDALEAALALGALDRAAASLEEALSGAQAAFVAVPVGALPQAVSATLAAAPDDCVVTDVGSTKRPVLAAHADQRFVGGHPVAGAETAGVRHARGDLFAGAVWYLTPSAATSGLLYERLHRLLHSFGALPSAIDAEAHDRILAAVSHLPHVLANALVARAAASVAGSGERLAAVGPSFRDATRVAGAPSAIWTDIYLSNRDALGREIDALLDALLAVREALERSDASWLTVWNDAAAEDRRRLVERAMASGPLTELRASVPNRPGVVAQVALELGRAGVNIADMALYPAPDMSEGVIALWIAGEQPARRAEELVAGLGFPVARA